MVVPDDQDGKTVREGESRAQAAASASLARSSRRSSILPKSLAQMRASEARAGGQIVVDLREFRSALPWLVYQAGMRVVPATLEVGDFVLSPDVAVERKSIPDLYSSFKSGRLYTQAQAMSRFYAHPVLLIEFTDDRVFSLQARTDIPHDIHVSNIISKLALLILHFPRLRIAWARNPHHSAAMFAAIKRHRTEPDAAIATAVGTDPSALSAEAEAAAYDHEARTILEKLPGITQHNIQHVMSSVESLAELARKSRTELEALMGKANGDKLYKFMHTVAQPEAASLEPNARVTAAARRRTRKRRISAKAASWAGKPAKSAKRG